MVYFTHIGQGYFTLTVIRAIPRMTQEQFWKLYIDKSEESVNNLLHNQDKAKHGQTLCLLYDVYSRMAIINARSTL